MGALVKICGITSVDDAQRAAECGADYLGLNLLAGPRRIDLALAAQIVQALPVRIKIAALTTSPTAAHPHPHTLPEIVDALGRVDVFQLYGPAPFDGMTTYDGGEYWIVTHIDDHDPAGSITERLDLLGFVPHAMLADRKIKTQLGGTGVALDWTKLAAAREGLSEIRDLPKLVLAGGLHAQNVAEAVRVAQPAVVDVSSGVEIDGQPGKKDAAKMRSFIQAARSVF